MDQISIEVLNKTLNVYMLDLIRRKIINYLPQQIQSLFHHHLVFEYSNS